jgi:hypothetical protein
MDDIRFEIDRNTRSVVVEFELDPIGVEMSVDHIAHVNVVVLFLSRLRKRKLSAYFHFSKCARHAAGVRDILSLVGQKCLVGRIGGIGRIGCVLVEL